MSAKKAQMYDVAVIGAGNAAMAAAMAAHEEGASVVILEKAPKEWRGGNTRFSGGLFRVAFDDVKQIDKVVGGRSKTDTVVMPNYTKEDFRNDVIRVTGGKTDLELVDFMIDHSLETLQWMSDIGVQVNYNTLSALSKDEKGRFRVPKGGPLRTNHDGIGLSDDWFDIVEKAGIPVFYETMALDLVKSDDGHTTGVLVRDNDGEHVIDCKTAIVASGGFSSSPEKRAKYLGPEWANVKVRGTRYNTGEIIQATIDAGAEAYGDWSSCHATPIDFEAPQYGDMALTDKSNRLSYPFSMMVNCEGERFVDEGEDIKILTYAKTGRAILKQTNAIGYQIFDSKVIQYLEPRYSTAKPVEADTLEELADKINERFAPVMMEKKRFLETAKEFNAAIPEKVDITPDAKDGNTSKGMDLEKTNWAQRLDAPPYRCYAATCGLTFTFGGFRVNTDAEVIDINGRRLEGLYATGEVLGGFFSYNYPAGTGLVRGAVYGRVAGRNAARYAKSNVTGSKAAE